MYTLNLEMAMVKGLEKGSLASKRGLIVSDDIIKMQNLARNMIESPDAPIEVDIELETATTASVRVSFTDNRVSTMEFSIPIEFLDQAVELFESNSVTAINRGELYALDESLEGIELEALEEDYYYSEEGEYLSATELYPRLVPTTWEEQGSTVYDLYADHKLDESVVVVKHDKDNTIRSAHSRGGAESWGTLMMPNIGSDRASSFRVIMGLKLKSLAEVLELRKKKGVGLLSTEIEGTLRDKTKVPTKKDLKTILLADKIVFRRDDYMCVTVEATTKGKLLKIVLPIEYFVQDNLSYAVYSDWSNFGPNNVWVILNGIHILSGGPAYSVYRESVGTDAVSIEELLLLLDVETRESAVDAQLARKFREVSQPIYDIVGEPIPGNGVTLTPLCNTDCEFMASTCPHKKVVDGTYVALCTHLEKVQDAFDSFLKKMEKSKTG